MADDKKIKVPDIGGATGVDVIEILVKVGDTISEETPLVTLESDKALGKIWNDLKLVPSCCRNLKDLSSGSNPTYFM